MTSPGGNGNFMVLRFLAHWGKNCYSGKGKRRYGGEKNQGRGGASAAEAA